jgi:monofunctional biosynthetic peptidoglycan transglycosylase
MRIPLSVKILLGLLAAVPVSLAALLFFIYLKIPTDKELRGCFTATMNQVYLCPGSKNYVPLAQISAVMKKTVVLTEDSAFFQHKGFDWESIERSAKENMEKGHYIRGGSTITQQLAKNLYLTKEKTLFRKFMEGLITLKLERSLSKNEILEKYLNVIEFGPGIYGIHAASEHYFKKSASELSPAESAFLAMLLPNPTKYSSSFKKKELTRFAESRIRKILGDLLRYQRIDQPAYDQAMQELPALFSPEQMALIKSLEATPTDLGSENDESLDEPGPPSEDTSHSVENE